MKSHVKIPISEQPSETSTARLMQRLKEQVKTESRVSRAWTAAATATFAGASALTGWLSYKTHDTAGILGNMLAKLRGGEGVEIGPCIDFFTTHYRGSPTVGWHNTCVNTVKEAVDVCLSFSSSEKYCLAKESPYCVENCATMDSYTSSYKLTLGFAIVLGLAAGAAGLAFLARTPHLKELCHPTLESVSHGTKHQVASFFKQNISALEDASIKDVIAKLEELQEPSNPPVVRVHSASQANTGLSERLLSESEQESFSPRRARASR